MKNLLVLTVLFYQVVDADVIYCTSVEDLYSAMVDVQAGDEIVIAPGTYLADDLAIYGTGAHFASYADGTEQDPIIMRSEDPDNPAILSGENAGSLSCVRIFGAFWSVQNLVVTNAQKGIVFDNAPFGEVINCTVYGIGYEAIHWRDGSDFGLIDGCRIYDTGTNNPGFGEAIYIGTDKGSWGSYDPDVTYVTIRNCVIGPGVAAEAFDIKEGTEEIIVEYNTINATGISNANYADSFIDLKGTRAYIRYNTFYRNGETKLTKGIAVIDRGVDLSSYEHAIHDNFFYLDADGSDINMVDAYSGTSDVYAWNNVRIPAEGDYYSSSVHDECCPSWYSPPDDGTCFAPFHFAVDDITNTTASFVWTGGISAVSYTLAYEVSGSGVTEQVAGLVSESFTLEGLHIDTVYLASVQATCDDDTSTFSGQVAFRTLSSDINVDDLPTPPPGVVVVYDDALAFGWSEHSYTGTYDIAHQTNTREGLFSIEAVYGSYGGLQLKHDGYPGGVFSYLAFWLRDDVTYGPSSPDIRLEVDSMQYEFKIESAGWHFMLVPIDDNSITEIAFKHRSSSSRTIYFDAIELWPELVEQTSSPLPSLSPSVAASEPPSASPVPSAPPSGEASVSPSNSPAPSRSPTATTYPTSIPSGSPSETSIPSTQPSPVPTTPPPVESSPTDAPATPAPVTLAPVASSTGTPIFIDSLDSEWTSYSYKGDYDFSSTTDVFEGSHAIEADYSSWGALHLKDNSLLSSAGLTSLSFAVKTTVTNHEIRVMVNGKQYHIVPVADEWVEFVLPLSLFQNPTSISTVTFQSRASSARIVYYDEIKFT